MASQVKKPGAKNDGVLTRFNNKFWQDPLVPIGSLATGGILVGGLWTLKTGQAGLSQRFMRARILAQGVTVVFLCMGGVMMGNGAGSMKPRETYEDIMMKSRMGQRAQIGTIANSPAKITAGTPVPPSPPSS